ncbi:hypothetical protein BH11ACT3_BH11ACT3_05820 [soil metagenome]
MRGIRAYKLQFMSNLATLLGIDVDSRQQRRALALAEADLNFVRALVEMRKRSGLKQRQVAELLGVSQSAISAIESYDNDPKLSTLRRYALAIGACVHHEVTPDHGHTADGFEGWEFAGRTEFVGSLTRDCIAFGDQVLPPWSIEVEHETA